MKFQSFLPEEQLPADAKLEYIRSKNSSCFEKKFIEFDLKYYIKHELEKMIKVFLA